jgi:hypothetical protein
MGFFRPPDRLDRAFSMSVSIGLRVRPRAGTAKKTTYTIEVRIGEIIAAKMGWDPGIKLELIWGFSDNVGRVALQVATKRGVRLRHTSNSTRSLLVTASNLPFGNIDDDRGRSYKLVLEPHTMTKSRHVFMGDKLGIELPEGWLKLVREENKIRAIG